MNERIKEIAGQVLDELVPETWVALGYDKIKEIQFRTAELIVQECIDKIETHRIPVGNSAAGEMACEWTYAALKEVRDEIKEHFRVEE